MKAKRALRILTGNIIMCAAYAWITVPAGIINGGVTSFSMSINRLTDGFLSVAIWASIITVMLAVLCYFFLGKTYFIGSLFSCTCYMVFFNIFSLIPVDYNLPIYLAVPIAGISVGIAYYLCLSSEATGVGMDTIAVIINSKWDKIPIAPCMYAINIMVILLGLYTYGIISVISGIVFAGIQAFVLNFLLKKKEKKE